MMNKLLFGFMGAWDHDLQELCKLPYVDSSRVYLTGVSMGGSDQRDGHPYPKFRSGYTRDNSVPRKLVVTGLCLFQEISQWNGMEWPMIGFIWLHCETY